MMKFYNYLDLIINMMLCLFNVLSDALLLFNVKARKCIKKNKTLVRNYDRCFIICTGPSLKKTDIRKIENADTMSVNWFYKSNEFDGIETTYHIAIDDDFYRDEKIDYIERVSKEHPNTKIFVKYKAYDLFKGKKNFFPIYAKQIQYSDHVALKAHKNMTAAINVSIMAVQLAISIGYKEIVLLGIDFSEYMLPNGQTEHFYSNKESLVYNISKGNQLRWFHLAYKHHYALQRWANNHGIRIINATPASNLDAYEMVDFENVKGKV